MSDIIVVVDARERALPVFMASVTAMKGNPDGVVLRKAVEIGKLADFNGKHFEFPVLVAGDYGAERSCGFTTQLGGERKVMWVGGAGFGFKPKGSSVRKGDALRPFARPVVCSLLPKWCRVEEISTHNNSNPATADAAMAGLKILSVMNPKVVVLAEGQSDGVRGFKFTPGKGEVGAFPVEHREDIFNAERLLEVYLFRRERSFVPVPAGKLFLEVNSLRDVKFFELFSRAELSAIGSDRRALLEKAFVRFADWTFKVQYEQKDERGVHLCAFSVIDPNGVVNECGYLSWETIQGNRKLFSNSEEEWEELKAKVGIELPLVGDEPIEDMSQFAHYVDPRIAGIDGN